MARPTGPVLPSTAAAIRSAPTRQMQESLASGVVPDPIRAVVAISDTVTPGSAKISAKATWTEDKVAEGQTGESTDTVVGTRNQEQTDTVDLPSIRN